MGREPYIPALRFHLLSALYDPMIRRWSAATRLRRSVIDALDVRPGHRVLELGAGPGRLAIELKRRHPDVAIDAIDTDAGMLARARRNAAGAGVDIAFHEADMTRLPELGTYDRVYSTMTFHHLCPRGKQAALTGARRVLREDGSFVVVDFGRPRDVLQRALFSCIQQPLDGFANTTPHRDGRFERSVRATFGDVRSAAVWRTIAGTLEMFVCTP
ncbi:MAG TPA: class I SAM-dependent methyltransferase [Kofleriaceae bacterium]|nr:class I SAM-dependent methyltransferase [Kofleriaceae bacterium]